jgi:predicted nucleotidyltransferase
MQGGCFVGKSTLLATTWLGYNYNMNKLKIKIPKAKIAEFCKRWNISEFAIFGSALRGDFRPDSDVDLLVVKSGRFHRGRLVDAIYRQLRGVGAPVDVIVVTPEEVERYQNIVGTVIYPALHEGRVLYERRS